MALQTNEKVSSVTSIPATKRVWPTVIQPKTLAAVSGAPTLAILTPLAFNTSTGFWVVWTSGGANGTGSIAGFLNEETVTSATLETLVNVILGGEIHYEDIPVPSGETLANLKTALRSGPRTLGLTITGLDAVH